MKKQSNFGRFVTASVVAASVMLAAPSVLAKKKHKDDGHNNPAPSAQPSSGELAKWDAKQDVKGFGKINVQGNATYGVSGLNSNQIAVKTKINFQKARLDVLCKADVTSQTTMCVNMITKKIEGGNGSGLSCTVSGMSSDFGKMPAKPKLSVCAEFKLKGGSNIHPKGMMKIYAEGGAAGAYKNYTIVKKDFK